MIISDISTTTGTASGTMSTAIALAAAAAAAAAAASTNANDSLSSTTSSTLQVLDYPGSVQEKEKKLNEMILQLQMVREHLLSVSQTERVSATFFLYFFLYYHYSHFMIMMIMMKSVCILEFTIYFLFCRPRIIIENEENLRKNWNDDCIIHIRGLL